VQRVFKWALEDTVRPEYRLVKLDAGTVEDLERLKSETGQASLNKLIIKMIRLTDFYRAGLKETGWERCLDRG
jgi:hypothetical protein